MTQIPADFLKFIERMGVSNLERAAVRNPKNGLATWLSHYARIKDKDGELVRPVLNSMQREVCEAISWCLVNKKPIRLAILKPRQKGGSTISVAAIKWFMRVFAAEAAMMGGQYSQTNNLWEIFRRFTDADELDWGFEATCGAKGALWGNGARIQAATARNENALRSATIQALLITEAARWSDGKVANPEAVLQGAIKCVPTRPETIVIIETTARGNTGFFHRYYQGGVTIAEAKAGKWPKNGFIKIFSPWFDHDDSRLWHTMPESKEFEKYLIKAIKGELKTIPGKVRRFLEADAMCLEPQMTYEESKMAAEFNLSPDQIRWHRFIMESECHGDWGEMKREYPKTAEEAFHASSNQWFSGGVMKLFRQRAIQHGVHSHYGTLESDELGERFAFQPVADKNDAFFRLFERPQPGLSYMIAVDVASLETTTSKETDKHSALVIRQGHYDFNTGVWKPPKLVARTIYNCRWDGDILAEMVYRLSVFYGKCRIVPEANNTGQGLIALLRAKGANLYRRTSADIKGDVTEVKATGNYGFLTTSSSRIFILEQLRTEVRLFNEEQHGIEIHDEDMVTEMENFILPKSGSPRAAEGFHDDDVLALAIGLYFVGSQATKYQMPTHRKELDKHLRGNAIKPGGQWSM